MTNNSLILFLAPPFLTTANSIVLNSIKLPYQPCGLVALGNNLAFFYAHLKQFIYRRG
jgi:hypothetical protein